MNPYEPPPMAQATALPYAPHYQSYPIFSTELGGLYYSPDLSRLPRTETLEELMSKIDEFALTLPVFSLKEKKIMILPEITRSSLFREAVIVSLEGFPDSVARRVDVGEIVEAYIAPALENPYPFDVAYGDPVKWVAVLRATGPKGLDTRVPPSSIRFLTAPYTHEDVTDCPCRVTCALPKLATLPQPPDAPKNRSRAGAVLEKLQFSAVELPIDDVQASLF